VASKLKEKIVEFKQFAELVNRKLNSFAGKELYVTAAPDDVWSNYLAAFPEGSNPIYLERTEHDCSCCRNFIRGMGNVVAIIDGKPDSIWNVKAKSPYKEVAEALHTLVTGSQIMDLWRTSEPKYGAQSTKQLLDGGKVKNWNHFYGDVPSNQRTSTPDKARGDFRTTVQVFKRGLTELSDGALDTAVDLINSKALYRGEEHLSTIKTFREAKQAFNGLSEADRETFAWVNASSPAARFRNTVIGTLIQDLSEGVELEKAVKSFEAKVAPANYKRPTALITEGMVKSAMAKIAELGIEQALERRYAKMSDVTINNVLWVNREASSKMKGGLESLLMTAVKPKVVDESKAENISIDDFMTSVLPFSTTVEVLLKNNQVGNLVSITAPVHTGSDVNLFKWDNDFAWSYNGQMADSDIRAAVQAKGGRVDGAFRFSHSWNHDKRNASLMDLHVFFPGWRGHDLKGCNDEYGSGNRVGWNRRTCSQTGASQDVDYTNAAPEGYIPVENITFPDLGRMPNGVYKCAIHNWSFRHPTMGGFKAEIEFAGEVFQYDHPEPLSNKQWVEVANVTLQDGKFSIEHKLKSGATSKPVWGVNTEIFVPVETVMLSPNHWDGNKVGNKHWFFILKGCKSPDTTRGIYNEFLHSKLEEHRKVFEVLGSKVKCPAAEEQLSGVGFSSTRNDTVTIRVTGDVHKTFNVKF
jgi:hypothetical protein